MFTFRLFILFLALLENEEVLLERHHVHVLAVVESFEEASTGRHLVLCEERVNAVEDEAALAVGQHEAIGEDLDEKVFRENAAKQTRLACETPTQGQCLRDR